MLGAEPYALADCFEAVFTIREEHTNVLQYNFLIGKLANSARLFNAMVRSSRTSEKRLMIYLSAIPEAYDKLMTSDGSSAMTK